MKPTLLKILMLEDSDADAEMIQRQLKKTALHCEFRVMMTSEAYQLALKEFQPDIILSDNAMPQFSASEALTILQQLNLHIPFILVTGTVSEEFAAGIIKAGADDYLLKDRLTRLPAAIEAALKQKQTEKENKDAATQLKQNEEKYRSMMERVTDGFVALNKDWYYTYVNKKAGEILNRKPEELIGKNIWAEFPEGMDKPFYKGYHKALDEQRYIHFEEYYQPFNLWLDSHIYPSPEGVSIYFSDITEKKEAEQKIIKANRLYFFISQVNQMIVRTTDATTLFKEVCSIAVEPGQFKMAWIGMIDEQTKKVIPVMHAGEEGDYLINIKPISIDDTPEGRGPTGRALREGKYVVCNDIENDPSMSPWKEAALGMQYLSSISVPIKKFGKVIGTFNVYAAEKNFFDAAEIELLEEATNDLSFALEVFEKESLRKRAEEAVTLSEQRYHTLTDVSPVGIFHTDATGYTTYVNPRWCQIAGLSFDKAIGYGWLEAVHEGDKQELGKGWERATEEQQLSTSEYRFVRPDGSVVWVLGQATPEKNAANEVVGYVGTTTDITAIKEADREIKKSNERFELIAKATNDALWDWNLETGKLWGNEAHQHLYGLTLADPVPGQEEWKKRIHAEDRERTVKALENAKASAVNSYVEEYRFYTENTGWMNVYGRTLIKRNNEGKALRLIGSMMDITERKKTEELLAANEKRFRKLVENGNDAFAILDATGKTIYVSSSVEKLLGYNEEEIYQMDMFSLVHPDNVADVQQTMQKVMANPGVPVSSHISRLRHKDGSWHWFEDTITNLLDDPDIKGIVDNFRDVTERINDQLALAESEDKHRNIVENITDILCTHDLEGRVLSVNRTAKKYLGYQIEEMLQMNIQDILLPYSKERFGTYIETIKKNGFVQGLMYVQTRTGENRIWEFRNSLRTEDIKIPYVYGFAQDVTERVRAEENLKDKNAQLQTLSDNLPGVMIYQLLGEPDGTRKFTYVSSGVTQITGNKPEEIIQNPSLLYDAILKEDLPKLFAAEMVSYQNMEVFNVEVRCQTYKGDIRWLNIISTPRKLDSGQIVWDGFHLDITERKKAEEVLKESEETFSKIFYLNPSVCAINDLQDDRFADVNEAFVNYFGFSKEEVIGKTSVELGIMDPGIRKNIISKMDEYGIVHNIETAVKTRSGENKDVLLSTSNIYLHKKEYAYTVSNDITERKKAEEAIKESEEKYRTLVEQASDGIFIADNTGKFVIVNSSACKLSGYTVAELAQLTIYDLVHPESLKAIPFNFEAMMQPQGARSERKMVCKNGAILDIEISAKFLSDKRFIAFIRDISERIKAAQAIKASEEKYRVLVEEASEGIFISNPQGRFITVNASACRIAQYSEEELLQMSFYDFFTEDDVRERPLQFEALRQGKTVISERVMKRKDGNSNHLEITSKLLTDGRLLSLVRDVAERKKAEEALMASEEKYRSLVEQASDAIFISDTNGRLVTVNSSACKLSQYAEEELLQMTILDFIVEEDIAKKAFRFDELKLGKTTVTERLMKNKHGQQLHVEVTAKLLSDGRLLAFVRDISERIKAQNEIIKEKNLSDSIINSLPASFFMINAQGKMLRWNRYLETASKYSTEEVSNMYPFDFFVEADKALLSEKIANVFLTGEDSVEATVSLKTGEQLPYYFKGIAIIYDGEPCMMGVGIDISERVKAQEEIKQTSEKLRELTAHLLNIREEERKRIGREIHDELGQQLTAIKMDVSWIDKKTPEETTLIKNKLKNIITLLDGSNQSIRRILSELRPGILDDYGLIEALEWQNRQFTSHTGIPVEFVTAERELKLPEPLATCIFRVYQEAFTNITRYAGATKVTALLAIKKGIITVSIEDNGQGFEAAALPGKKSFGILGMKERVLAQGGNFELLSSLGKGTKMTIRLPFVSHNNIVN